MNARFEIMQKMLNIWSEHSQVTYITRLDVVVALLIVIEVGTECAEQVRYLNVWRWREKRAGVRTSCMVNDDKY